MDCGKEYKYILALRDYGNKNFNNAIKICDSILTDKPFNKDFLFLKAMCYAEIGMQIEAAMIDDSFCCIYPEESKHMAQKAYINARIGRKKEAIKWVKKSLETSKNSLEAKRFAAYTYEVLDENVKALSLATTILDKETDNHDMLIVKRNTLNKLGKTNEAVLFWDKALKIRYANESFVTINTKSLKGDLELRLIGGGIISNKINSYNIFTENMKPVVDEIELFKFMKSLNFIFVEKQEEHIYLFKKNRALLSYGEPEGL